MSKAAQVYGGQVLAAPEDAGTARPEDVGRSLVRLIFGAEAPGREMPGPLAVLIASPGSVEALTAMDIYIEEMLEQDFGLAAAVAEMLTGFLRGSSSPVTARRWPTWAACCGGTTRNRLVRPSSARSKRGTSTR